MFRIIALTLMLSIIGRPQACPEFVEFTPNVILDDGLSSTRLELKGRENTQSVTLELPTGTPVKIGGTSPNTLHLRYYPDANGKINAVAG